MAVFRSPTKTVSRTVFPVIEPARKPKRSGAKKNAKAHAGSMVSIPIATFFSILAHAATYAGPPALFSAGVLFVHKNFTGGIGAMDWWKDFVAWLKNAIGGDAGAIVEKIMQAFVARIPQFLGSLIIAFAAFPLLKRHPWSFPIIIVALTLAPAFRLGVYIAVSILAATPFMPEESRVYSVILAIASAIYFSSPLGA